MSKIRIGQIGIGHNHGQGKMKTVRAFPDVFEVVGVAETDPQWIEQRSSLEVYQGLTWMTPEALLAIDHLDAVLVETDVWKLVPTARACIDRGLHVHLDKPAGEDIQAFASLLQAAAAKDRIVQMGYMYRYNPAVQYCLEAVRNGRLGEIVNVDAVMSTAHAPEFRTWLRHFKGGTMYIFGCHLIDLILLIQGKPEGIISYQKQTGFDDVDVYDNGLAVLEYAKGTSTVRTSSVEINGYGRRQLVVCGQQGSIEIKPLERPMVLAETMRDDAASYRDSRKIIELLDVGERYDAMLCDFAAMIRGEKANPFDYAHELLVQQVTLKACGFDMDD